MSLFDRFSSDRRVSIDGRARFRDRDALGLVRVVKFGSMQEIFSALTMTSRFPVATVTVDGSVTLMSAADGGEIWVIGDELNSKQTAIVDELRNVMVSLGAPYDASEDMQQFSDAL